MVLYRGKEVRVTVGLEATGTAVITSSTEIRTSTNSAEATTSGGSRWLAPLADTASDDYESTFRQNNIETLDLKTEPTREEFDLVGKVTKEYPKMRDAFEVTITRKMDSQYFAQLYDKADHGVSSASTTTNSWRPSDDQRSATDGFRLFVWVATNSVYTFRNAALREHKIAVTPNKITVETLVFAGNLWTVSSTPNVTATTAAEL
jgi:hypothetical protein